MAKAVFKDIDMNFAAHPVSGDVSVVTNDNDIKQSIRNLVMTNTWDRRFNSKLGTYLYRALFEPANGMTYQIVKKTVFDTLTDYEPRITVVDVLITPYEDNNAIVVDVIYTINNTSVQSNVKVVMERTR